MAWRTTRPSLLTRVRNLENVSAWCEFDRQYGDLILSYARARSLQPTDAEDVRQRVLAALAQALPCFRYQPERGQFRSYLRRAIDREVSRQKRSLAKHPLCLENADAVCESDGDLWQREWMHHHLRHAFGEVRKKSDPKSVRAFEAFLGGETLEEIADRLGMSKDAVRKMRDRLRDKMKEIVARRLSAEDEPYVS